MPTSYPRHSITETPALTAVLEPLRQRLGTDAPTFGELVLRGAQSALRELDAREQVRCNALATFVDRLREGPEPDLAEVHAVRHTVRHP